MQSSVGERLAPTALLKILSTSENTLLPISQKGPDGVTHDGSVTGDKGGLGFVDLCGYRGSQRWWWIVGWWLPSFTGNYRKRAGGSMKLSCSNSGSAVAAGGAGIWWRDRAHNINKDRFVRGGETFSVSLKVIRAFARRICTQTTSPHIALVGRLLHFSNSLSTMSIELNDDSTIFQLTSKPSIPLSFYSQHKTTTAKPQGAEPLILKLTSLQFATWWAVDIDIKRMPTSTGDHKASILLALGRVLSW
jgi:hypothetical protein